MHNKSGWICSPAGSVAPPSYKAGGIAIQGSQVTALAKRVSLLRIAFGVIWAIDSMFKWTPAFQNTYLSQVYSAARGQPAWLLWLFHSAESVIRLDPHFFAVATAVIETATALGLILGFARRTGYVAGLIFSLVVWALAEGFGGPYTAGSTDVGTGIIYAVVFAALYGLDRAVGRSPWSLDALINRHWPDWERLSEPGLSPGDDR